MIPDNDIPVFLFLLCIIIVFGLLVQIHDEKLIDLEERRNRDREDLFKHLDDKWDENSYH